MWMDVAFAHITVGMEFLLYTVMDVQSWRGTTSQIAPVAMLPPHCVLPSQPANWVVHGRCKSICEAHATLEAPLTTYSYASTPQKTPTPSRALCLGGELRTPTLLQ